MLSSTRWRSSSGLVMTNRTPTPSPGSSRAKEAQGRVSAVPHQPQKLHLRVVERLHRTIFAVITA
jgi:hypothetical protein